MKRTNLFFGLAFALFCSLPMYAQTVSEDVDINTTSESATPDLSTCSLMIMVPFIPFTYPIYLKTQRFRKFGMKPLLSWAQGILIFTIMVKS